MNLYLCLKPFGSCVMELIKRTMFLQIVWTFVGATSARTHPDTLLNNPTRKIYDEFQGNTAQTSQVFWRDHVPKWFFNALRLPGSLDKSAQNSIKNQLCKVLSLPENCEPELVKNAARLILTTINYPASISTPCVSDLVDRFLGDLLANQTFSILQLDATGKPAPGILEGNVNWPGNFQQCINIDSSISNTRYKGKYCTVSIRIAPNMLSENSSLETVSTSSKFAVDLSSATPNISYCNKLPYNADTSDPSIKWGICVPNSCSEMEIFSVLFTMTAVTGSSLICNVQCQERPPLPWTAGAIFMLFLLSCFGFVMVIGTFFDYFIYQPNEANYPRTSSGGCSSDAQKMTKQDYYNTIAWYFKVIHAFSLYTNGKKILDTSTKPGQIDCVHALRFISMSWVIMGHSFEVYSIADNPVEALKLKKNFIDQIIFNASFSVDTFFLISGLLLSFLWFKDMNKCKGKTIKSPFTWINFYVHRYLRLTPVYAILLGAEVTLMRYMMRGPYASNLGTPDYENCKKYWWTNLLYINNFVGSGYTEMCHSEFWYLANDMQFHIIAPVFLITLFYIGALGVAVCLGTILLSMCIIFGLVMSWHLPAPAAFLAPYDPKLIDPSYYWKYMYIVPWTRINPYIIGILLGWYMQKWPKLTIPKVLNITIWLVVSILCSAILFGLLSYQQGTYMAVGERAVYSAFCRTLWAFGIAWVILACYTGNGEPVNELLSWSGWIPLSRLTYCAYLTHVALEYVLICSYDHLPHWSTDFHFIMTHFVPLLFLAYLVSFFSSAAFEVPVMSLEKLGFGMARKAQNKEGSASIGPRVHELTAPEKDIVCSAATMDNEDDTPPKDDANRNVIFKGIDNDAFEFQENA